MWICELLFGFVVSDAGKASKQLELFLVLTNPHEKGKFMFARFKTLTEQNLAIVPYKVVALLENSKSEGKTTTIYMDFGASFEVQGSERAVRGALVKASGNAPAPAEASNEEPPAE